MGTKSGGRAGFGSSSRVAIARLLRMGVHGGADAREAEDPLMDVGLGGRLVVAVIRFRRRKEADLLRLEIALLGTGQR